MSSRRGVLGMLLVLVGLLGTTWAMYHLVRTGTCASGGPYVSARPCPAGTGLKILALMGGILLSLVGAGVARNGALGTVWFGLLFTVTGAIALVVAGDETGGLIMGSLFIGLMGLPAVAAGLWMADGGDDEGGSGGPQATIPTPATPWGSSGDEISMPRD